MKKYLDVYNEVKEALPWMNEDRIKVLSYRNWKAQNEVQPVLNIESPKIRRFKKRQAKRKQKPAPKLYAMTSEECKKMTHLSSRSKFKLCDGRKIRHTFICNRCGMGRSFGYITPYGLLCPKCAAKKTGGRGAPHCYTVPMRD